MRFLGNKGEDYAVKLLKKEHYKIIERNFTVRGGEIDIIASDSGTLVFVEVKMRKNSDYGTPGEFVTFGKQKKLIYAANCYLEKHSLFSLPCRFDVVEITGEVSEKGKIKVREANIIKNAFSC